MKIYGYCLFLAAILVLLAGCQQQKEPVQKQGSITAKIAEPDSLLLLAEIIPLGSGYASVKKEIPALSELKDRGYDRMAQFQTSVLNQAARVQFLFTTADSLYNIMFTLTKNLDCSVADSLYGKLQDFYGSKFGKYEEEEEPDPGASPYPIFRVSRWHTGKFEVVVGNNEYDEFCILSWGFQRSSP